MPSALCSPYWRLAGSDVWRKSFEEFLVCCIAEDAAHCIVAASVPEKFQNLPKFLKIFLQHPHGSICDPEANRPYCTIPRFQGETFDRNLQLATHVKNLAQRKGANAMQSREWRFSIAEEHYAVPAVSPLSSICGAVPLLASVGMIELLPWLADAVLESKTGEDSPARWLRCG